MAQRARCLETRETQQVTTPAKSVALSSQPQLMQQQYCSLRMAQSLVRDQPPLSRSVLKVMEYRSMGTGGTLCCQSHRASPRMQ